MTSKGGGRRRRVAPLVVMHPEALSAWLRMSNIVAWNRRERGGLEG